MRAGRLDRRITIQVFSLASPAINADGQESGSWVTLANEWAEIMPMGGSEAMRSQQELAQENLIFTIRFRPDITPEHRILYNSKNYDIISVLEIKRRKGLKMQCRENVA